MGEKHHPSIVVLILLSLAVWAAAVVLNAISAIGGEVADGLFLNTTGATSDFFATDIIPGNGAFFIWQLIFPWLGLLTLYFLVNVFRRTKEGPLYVNPPVLSPVFYVTYVHLMIFLTAWVFLFDRQLLWMALADLFLTTATSIACLGVSARALHLHGGKLRQQGNGHDVWIMRVLVHNGLAILGAWCTLATHLNASFAMAHSSPLGVATASTVAAAILAGVLALFFLLDLTVWDRYTRYVVTPYLTVLWGLSWILQKNWDPEKTSSVIAAVLLAVSGLATLVKLVLLVWRTRTRPLLSRPDDLLPTIEKQTKL